MRAGLRVFTIIVSVLCSVLGAQRPSPNSVSGDAAVESLYIIHVTVINTDTGKEARNQTVLISGERISEVDDSNKVKVAAGAKVVDGTGKYLIPGLWDMHVHIWDYDSTYPLFIANGVTGVREMFGPPDANKFRAELAAKAILVPHFYLASPIIDGNPPRWANSIAVSSAEDARRAVDEQKNKGADFIKVYDVLSRESYFAIADESRRQKISFVGHVPILVTAREASDAGQKSDEHLRGIPLACSSREEELQSKMTLVMPAVARNRLDLVAMRNHSEEKCQRLFSVFKKNRTWQVPTLTLKRSFARLDDEGFRRDDRLRFFREDYRTWLAPQDDSRLKTWTAADFATERELFAYAQKLVGAMFRAGVLILAGTDTGNPYCFPGFSLHDELALLVESGLTPLAALQAATRNAAIFMNASDKYGSVSPGKIADLVLLDADPLKDIHSTTNISEVFLSGKELNRAALDQMLKAAEVAAASPRTNELRDSPAAAGSGRPSGGAEAVEQVLAVDEARRLAMLHRDVSALDSLLADDVTIFWGDGTADDKAATLALLRSGRLRYAQLDYENTRVRVYGETAVVAGQARVKEQSDNERPSYLVRVTRVYVRQQGRWRLVASQTTRVAPMP